MPWLAVNGVDPVSQCVLTSLRTTVVISLLMTHTSQTLEVLFYFSDLLLMINSTLSRLISVVTTSTRLWGGVVALWSHWLLLWVGIILLPVLIFFYSTFHQMTAQDFCSLVCIVVSMSYWSCYGIHVRGLWAVVSPHSNTSRRPVRRTSRDWTAGAASWNWTVISAALLVRIQQNF